MVQERRWTALTPVKAETDADTKLTIEKDSVLAKGTNSIAETYTVSFTNAVTGIVGLRIEALPHNSLPAKGPGRAGDGNFVLTEVVASILRPDHTTNLLSFTSARADFEPAQSSGTNFNPTGSAAAVIDGDVKDATAGWAIGSQTNQAHQLVLGFAAPVSLQDGETLVVELKQKNPGHALGYFRIGATTNTEALAGPLRYPPAKEISDLLLIAADAAGREAEGETVRAFQGDRAGDRRSQEATG